QLVESQVERILPRAQRRRIAASACAPRIATGWSCAMTQINQAYKHGFVTDVETETIRKGLDEDVIRLISKRKNEPEWLLDYRLKAYRHWLTMTEPHWAHAEYKPIDYQDIYYFSAPKSAQKKVESLDDLDPELLKTFERLGIPLTEQK